MPLPVIAERIAERTTTQLILKQLSKLVRKTSKVFNSKEIKDIIINHQSELINYIIIASDYHEKLSKYLLENKLELEQQEESRIEKLRDKFHELENFLNDHLKTVCDKNFDFIIKYLSSRSNIEPRVCIKAIHNNRIYGIFRHKYNQDLNEETIFLVQENTAFSYICQEGKFYHCLDIPRAIANGEYKNARIIEQRAKLYLKGRNQLTSGVKRLLRKPDLDWMVCWKDNPSRPESCYKSTLVFPMIILENDAKTSVKKFYSNNLQTRGIIFGFLCLDHHMENFFNLEEDKNVGYIFAEILSIYFAIYSKYGSCSESFRQARKYLSETE